jgi:hypothetical protein
VTKSTVVLTENIECIKMNRTGMKCPRNKKKSNASLARKKRLPACTSDTAQKKKNFKAVRKRKVRSVSQGPVSGKRKRGAKTSRRKPLKRKCPRKKKK